METAGRIVEAVIGRHDGENFSQYTSLCITSSGLECVLACQGDLSLLYAAIYEPIF